MFKGCQNVNKVKWNIASKSSNSVVQFYKYNRQNGSLCLPSRLPVNNDLFFSTLQFSGVLTGKLYGNSFSFVIFLQKSVWIAVGYLTGFLVTHASNKTRRKREREWINERKQYYMHTRTCASVCTHARAPTNSLTDMQQEIKHIWAFISLPMSY